MEKRQRRKRHYSPEFKIGVIVDMREHRLGYEEVARTYVLAGTDPPGGSQPYQKPPPVGAHLP